MCSGPSLTAMGYQLARRHTEKNVLCVFQEYISHQQGTPTEGSKRLTKANNSLWKHSPSHFIFYWNHSWERGRKNFLVCCRALWGTSACSSHHCFQPNSTPTHKTYSYPRVRKKIHEILSITQTDTVTSAYFTLQLNGLSSEKSSQSTSPTNLACRSSCHV